MITHVEFWTWECDTCTAPPESFESEANAIAWSELHPKLTEHTPGMGAVQRARFLNRHREAEFNRTMFAAATSEPTVSDGIAT